MTYYSRRNPIKKIVAYLRYSSDNQNPVSLEIQLEEIKEYAEENKYEIVKVFQDKAKSGRGTAKRIAYESMIEGFKDKSIDCDAVAVYRYDRIGRNVGDMKKLEEVLGECEKRLLSVKEPMDDSTAGKFHKNIQYAVSEYESGIIGDRVVDGLKKNASQGVHCGGITPLGYVLDENQKIVIEPTESEAVRLVFQMYDGGCGYREIAEYLNELKYMTKKKLPFKHNSVRDILQNEKYNGTFTYNKAYPRNPNGRNNSRLQKDDEDIIRIKDNHEPIISKELFDRVQERRKQKSKKPRNSKNNYIFAGIIKCDNCTAMMHGDVSHDSKNKDKIHSYYRCRNKKVKVCDTKPVNRYTLEDFVLQNLHQMIFKNVDLERLTNQINDTIVNDKRIVKELKRCESLKSEQERQESNLMNNFKLAGNSYKMAKLNEQWEELCKNKEDCQKQIDKLKAEQKTYTVDDVRRAIEKVNEFVKANKNEITRGYIQSYVKNILVDNDNIRIILNKENDCA